METSSPPHPATDLEIHLYYQVVYTLGGLLPPPIDDTPEARYTRDHAAKVKMEALLPVNANEVDLAAQCIAAWAQAEEMLRLGNRHADDTALMLRLNRQYASMVRTALAVHGRLMRVQAVRQKREATEGTVQQDAWTRHVVERSMLVVADPDAARQHAAQQSAARPEAAPVAAAVGAPVATQVSAARPEVARPKVAPVAAPTASVAPRIEKNVSNNGIGAHDVAFETCLREISWNQGSKG